MSILQALRNAHLITRFMLVWFVLSIGVAIASPLVQPQTLTLICSGAGMMTVVTVSADDDSQQTASPLMHCPLCVNASAPPLTTHLTAEPTQALDDVLQSLPSVLLIARIAAPLPARGPPNFS